MKQVMVKSKWWLGNPEIQHLMLENVDDVLEYANITQEELGDVIKRFMCSKVKPDDWDHMLRKEGQGDAIMNASWTNCCVNGGNPLLKSGDILNEKIRNMLVAVMDGETLLVNKSGGYFHMDENTTIVSDAPFDMLKKKKEFVIADNASYINLENDPELEQHTLNFFAERGVELSYVTNLRNFDKDDLVVVLNQFYGKGGHSVYVYTTGMDVEQMHMYSDAIIESKIECIVFEFNSGMSSGIREVIDHLKENDVIVTWGVLS